MFSLFIFIVINNNAIEKTNPILAIFEPITFEIAMSLEFFNAELILINNSGVDVANETIVRPITSFETLYFNDKSTELLKSNSLPTTNNISPSKRKTNSKIISC